jgi:hypothetical protein
MACDIDGFARVTAGALAIVQTPWQLSAIDIAITLAVWLVAIRARHGARQIAITPEMSLLIRERANPSIGMDWLIGEKR